MSLALSDLSVTEFITLGRMGFYPRGLVTGACVFDTSFNSRTFVGGVSRTTQEVTAIGQAMHTARARALTKLRTEAEKLGAEGVVGVQLDVDKHTWRGGQVIARFVAVGTAIAFDRERAPKDLANAPSLRPAKGPFTSDLSAHDLTTLMRAGYRPVELAMGNCVYQLSTMTPAGALALGNVELSDYTAAFAQARETAMTNLLDDLRRRYPSGPDAPVGVVGMTVNEGAHGGMPHMIEFTAIGTAVARLADNDPRKLAQPPTPSVVVPLDG